MAQSTVFLTGASGYIACRLAAQPLARVSTSDRRDDLEARVEVIEDLMGDQIRLNNIYNGKFGSLSRTTSSLSERIEQSRFQNVGLDGDVR